MVWKTVYTAIACIGTALLFRCIGPLDNPSDSKAETFTVKSKAVVSAVGTGPFYQYDTARFIGRVASEPVDKARLVHEYAWDFGNDGTCDTTLRRSDTVRIRLKSTGNFTVALRLRDGIGNTSRAQTTITVVRRPIPPLDTITDTVPDPDPDTITNPDTTTTIDTVTNPKVFVPGLYLPDINLSIDTVCAFYTKNEYTMRPILLLGRYLTYRNKSESMSLGSFVFEVLKNLTGTLDYNTLTLPYQRGFDRGVYTMGNDSLSISAVFHYGPGVAGHAENDTIRDDLFNPLSYIKSFKVQVSSPYYSYEKGPLWDLSSGFSVDVSNPLKPKVSLNVAFTDLKFSCYREVSGRYTMSSEMNDTGGLMVPQAEDFLFHYEGLSRIHPLRIGSINTIVQADSLEMDMAGSRIQTDTLPMTFTRVSGSDTLKSTFNFRLHQLMEKQLVRFGTGGGERKVLGTYGAQSGLSVDKLTFTTIYFDGVYSTAAADTALFYCDEDRKNRFGTLLFDSPVQGSSTFVSDRYNYRFVMKQSVVTLVK